VKESEYCKYFKSILRKNQTSRIPGMSFYREREVNVEIATLNERLLIFQARGRPTTKLKEKN